MKIVKMSSKNQVTIPNEFLLRLNLQPMARFVLEAKSDALVMKPLKRPIVDQTAGSLTKFVSPSKLGIPFLKILKETKKKTATKLAKK